LFLFSRRARQGAPTDHAPSSTPSLSPEPDAALTPAEAAAALACVPRPPATAGGPDGGLAALAGGRSAADLLAAEAGARRVITFCAALDELLGGGVPPGQLTEFCEFGGGGFGCEGVGRATCAAG
jgi:hypothetical protein